MAFVRSSSQEACHALSSSASVGQLDVIVTAAFSRSLQRFSNRAVEFASSGEHRPPFFTSFLRLMLPYLLGLDESSCSTTSLSVMASHYGAIPLPFEDLGAFHRICDYLLNSRRCRKHYTYIKIDGVLPALSFVDLTLFFASFMYGEASHAESRCCA